MLFQYTNIDRTTIRLVKFLPYSTPSNIYLSLEHQSRYYEGNVRYNALSYVCGDINDRRPITMGGRTFLVTSNLWSALSAMVRYHDISTPFWVDSICINQQDPIEKSMEASQMWRIFSNASKVMAWIGDSDEKSGKAFDVLREGAVGDEELVVSSVLSREYFRRAWVRTEVSKARDAEMLCGEHKCDFASLHKWLRNRTSIDGVPSNTMKLIQSYGSRDNKLSASPWEDFQTVLDEYTDCHTSDIRDRIFALLNDPRIQALDSFGLPSISYSLTAEDIAFRMIIFFDRLSKCEQPAGAKSIQCFLNSLAKALDLPDSVPKYREMVQNVLGALDSAGEIDQSGPVMRFLLNQLGEKSRC